MSGPSTLEREVRVTAVLVRAAALSDELRTTIRELETILRRDDSELVIPSETKNSTQHREGE